jgi:hypothetical protein
LLHFLTVQLRKWSAWLQHAGVNPDIGAIMMLTVMALLAKCVRDLYSALATNATMPLA